jgi:hypothetical protein
MTCIPPIMQYMVACQVPRISKLCGRGCSWLGCYVDMRDTRGESTWQRGLIVPMTLLKSNELILKKKIPNVIFRNCSKETKNTKNIVIMDLSYSNI